MCTHKPYIYIYIHIYIYIYIYIFVCSPCNEESIPLSSNELFGCLQAPVPGVWQLFTPGDSVLSGIHIYIYIYMYIYIYIYIYVSLFRGEEAEGGSPVARLTLSVACALKDIRPVRLLRVWISEGLT